MDGRLPDGHLLEVIGERASRLGDTPALGFVQDASGATKTLTWAEVQRGAWRALQGFKAQGLRPGDRVVLMLPTGESYLAALLGAIWGGMTPSTFPRLGGPTTSVGAEAEWRGMMDGLAPALIVTDTAPAAASIPVIAPETLLRSAEAVPTAPDYSDLRALTYVQFTSGSTGQPRGLALHWPAIRANLRAIARGAPIVPEDRCVSWLPMYHDMGLFGTLMTPLYVGCMTIYMDASLFATSPLLWLRLLAEHRATVAVTPPSAFQRCIDLLRRRERPELDLSALSQIICGSEPVSPHLVERVREVLGPCGVPAAALKPVYGLAEATLAVTFPPPRRPPRVDCVEQGALETEGLARPAEPGSAGAQEWVSAGAPVEDTSVRIVDETGRSLRERRVGRILIQSPSLMSAVVEHGTIKPRDGDWLDTGDLGYMAEGELYVTGRRKDVIIKYGRNYSPDRIEHLACLTDGVRRAIAFGVFDEARLTERIVVAVEVRGPGLNEPGGRDRRRLTIRGHLHAAGYAVDEIVIAEKIRLPRTASGKVCRQECRELYLRQQLGVG